MTDELMALLPCPFCTTVFPPVATQDKSGCIVICTGCSALGPARSTRAEAIAAWNCRTELPALIEREAALREEVERLLPLAVNADGDYYRDMWKSCRANLATVCAVSNDYAEKNSALLSSIGTLEKALQQIAGTHFERYGMDQTDIEELPDLSAEEAVSVARAALGSQP